MELYDMLAKENNIQIKHLFWTLFFLKAYNTADINAIVFDTSEKVFRERTEVVVEQIYNLDIIQFSDRFEGLEEGVSPCFSLDGTDCWIQEPHPFNKDYFSHKFKHAGLRYEIGLALGTCKIVWVGGGVPCGANPDITIAQSSKGVVDSLLLGERAIADKGYNDQNIHFLTPFNRVQNEAQKTFNIKHKKIMARHEKVNKRIKQFDILNRFRHKNDLKHKLFFYAVVNITQISLRYSPLESVDI
jgi:hypothetical protein